MYIPVARTKGVRREGQTINISIPGGGEIAVGERATVTAGSCSSTHLSLPATAHVFSFDRVSPLDFEQLCL